MKPQPIIPNRERLETFLATPAAEQLFQDAQRKAEADRDARRAMLFEQLAVATGERAALLKEPEERLLAARTAYEQAMATAARLGDAYQHAFVVADAVRQTCDHKESTLRFELELVSPPVVRACVSVLSRLASALTNATYTRDRATPTGHGGTQLIAESNISATAPAIERVKQIIAELEVAPHAAITFAEIEARCRDAIRDALGIVEPLLPDRSLAREIVGRALTH